MTYIYNKLTNQQLNNLNTKRLLNVYRLARRMLWSLGGWDQWAWPLSEQMEGNPELRKEVEENKTYIDEIKKILDTREHIE